MSGDDRVPNDPIRSMAAGVTDSIIDHGKAAVTSFVKKLQERKLALVQTKANVNLAKEQRKKPEWQIYQEYVSDKHLRVLIQMGMALRELEPDPANKNRIKGLRDLIRSKYSGYGLHIAQVVQTGMLAEVFRSAIDKAPDKETAQAFIEETLSEAEGYCVFIREDDDPKRKAEEILHRLDADYPEFLFLLSKGDARTVMIRVGRKLQKKHLNYAWKKTEDEYSLIYTLSRKSK